MANDTTPMQTTFEVAAHDMLVANLRNTHALEKQTIAVLQGQLTLLEDYPDLHARVTEHIVESRDQARRLEAGLEACGSSASMFKDALLSVMGMGQSSVQGFGDNAVLKAVVADMMTEHLEIATYRTLLQLADLAGKPELRPRLEESLREEEAMAAWFDDNLESITRRAVDVRAGELRQETAVTQEEATTADGEPAPTMWQTLDAADQSDGQSRSAPKANSDSSRNMASAPADTQPQKEPTADDGNHQAAHAGKRSSDD